MIAVLVACLLVSPALGLSVGKNIDEGVDLERMIKEILNEKLRALHNKLDVSNDKLLQIRSALKRDQGSVLRHNPFNILGGNAQILDLYTTNTPGQINNCGTGQITRWTVNVNQLNTAKGGQQFNAGTFTNNGGSGFYYVHMSLTCSEGSICDVTLRRGGTRIAAMGNRYNCCSNRRWAQMTQGLPVLLSMAGQTMSIFMEATGGGFGTQNCYRETGWRSGRWTTFLIRFQ